MISGKKDEFSLLPDNVCQYAKNVVFHAKSRPASCFTAEKESPRRLPGAKSLKKRYREISP